MTFFTDGGGRMVPLDPLLTVNLSCYLVNHPVQLVIDILLVGFNERFKNDIFTTI